MDLKTDNFNCIVSQLKASECYDLQSDWLQIEDNSDQSYFLSWNWTSSWLSVNFDPNDSLIVVRVTKDYKAVGLALFSLQTVPTFLGKKLKQLWLNKTGNDSKDQIWVEHNDFLVTHSDSDKIRSIMFDALLAKKDWWDEIFIGLTSKSTVASLKHQHKYMREIICSLSFKSELSDLLDLQDYLKTLSKNTRSQISRSKRGLETAGSVKLVFAQSSEEKLEYLRELSILHIEKWGNTPLGSGFINPLFVDFHESIIKNDVYAKSSRIYCLKQDERALGYVYLFIKNGTWSFYLSAIKFHTDPKIKIGLLLHTLVIEQAIKEKAKCYDFLAGEAQYKKSLSNTLATEQKLVCFYRPSFYMRVRERLRKLKNLCHHQFLE